MSATSLFEITRRDPSINASARFTPAQNFDPVPRGFALGAHPTDPESFEVAQHNTFIGHLTRQVRSGGLTLVDRVFGVTSDTPIGIESPFTAGQEVSVEKAREIEAEGAAYLVQSGVRALLTNTAVGAPLSFKDGYLGLSQAGELVNYKLTANNLSAQNPGSLRIRAEAV